MILWQQLQQQVLTSKLEGNLPDADRPLIFIDSQLQQLSLVYQDNPESRNYPVSTSRYGIGQKSGSYQTPAGIHRVAQKVGEGEPLGRVFKSREAQPQICLPDDFDGTEDLITTRILWLEGLQPGINRHGDVDSFDRYIYIHGTADEAHIGQPASIGCIRMRNHDVMEIFEQIQVNDLVIIE